jgi:hypothetical protein
MATAICCLLSGSARAASNPDRIEGAVKAVSMTTTAGPKNFTSPKVDLSETDSKSTVVIQLDRPDHQQFNILTSDIVKLEGFKDLDGRHRAMGGLLILSDLQKRLVGKNIIMKCRKITQESWCTIAALTP